MTQLSDVPYSEQQLVNCVTVVSGCNDELSNNGFDRCFNQRQVEADRQTYSLFRESSSVALQTSTDLKSLKVVTMVRRIAVQKHSAAHVQLASCISAIMKFGAGADGDPFVKVKVQTVSAWSNWSGSFDQLTDGSKTSLPRCSEQCLAAQVDQSGQEYVSD